MKYHGSTHRYTSRTSKSASDITAIQPAYYGRVSENQARRNIDGAANHKKKKHTDAATMNVRDKANKKSTPLSCTLDE